MDCPFCGGDSRVVDSRPGRNTVRRRRECERCHGRFSTLEVLSVGDVRVRKRGPRPSEAFDPAKLLRSLQRLSRGLSVGDEILMGIVREVELYAIRRGRGFIESSDIAMIVAEALRDVDGVAWQRFISNYRQSDGEVRFSVASTSDQPSEGTNQLILFDEE